MDGAELIVVVLSLVSMAFNLVTVVLNHDSIWDGHGRRKGKDVETPKETDAKLKYVTPESYASYDEYLRAQTKAEYDKFLRMRSEADKNLKQSLIDQATKAEDEKEN